MLEDQQAQLTLHQEAVERHNQRTKLRLTNDSSREVKSAETTSAAALESSSAAAEAPEWMRSKGIDALLSEGRMKYRHVLKLVMALLQFGQGASQLLKINQSGSHKVAHLGSGASPFTIVEHHGSADSIVPRFERTKIFQRLLGLGLQPLYDRENSKQRK